LAITREKKEQFVARYRENLSRSKAVFFTDYRGLSVSGMEELRTKIRAAGGGYVVVKNTLAARALSEAGLPFPEGILTGPVGIGFAYEEVPALAKVFSEFAKDTEILEIKGGILSGEIINSEQIASLASLPAREVVFAQLLGLLQQPGNRVAGVVNAAGTKLAATIKAYADQLESSQPAA
jgi:large subunit ribosomal protein L10